MSGLGRLKLKGHGVIGGGSDRPALSSSSSSSAVSGFKRLRSQFEGPDADAGARSSAYASASSGVGPAANGAKPGLSSVSSSSSSSGPSVAGGSVSVPAGPPRMTAAQRIKGSGTITASGTAITGIGGTRFKAEAAVGDAIEVLHPRSMVPEVRVIKMVLGDTSIGVGSAFSSDIGPSPAAYHILKLPKAIKSDEEKAAEARRRIEEQEKAAYGRYGGNADGTTYTYREKKSEGAGGTYRIKTVTVEKGMTREELLDLRSKVKGDKFC